MPEVAPMEQAPTVARKVSDVPITSLPANPIKKKIDKLVASKVHNDPEFQKVLDYVSPMVENIDIHTERRLARQLQERELELNDEYLNELTLVNAQVQAFASKVRAMHQICSDLTTRIEQNKEKTQDLLSKTNALQNQKKHLETKKKAIDDFLGKYSLSDAEQKALEGSPTDGTVSNDMFPALTRAKEIYNQSKHLLRSSGEHSAALEIMEEMSQRMEKAYETLYRSIQRECRVLNTDYVELKNVLILSFAALEERDVLFKYALDEYCTARKNHILRLYIDALTKGVHGTGKPIEMMSHDPFRYVGDMLAWTYETIEGEKELLEMLLKHCSKDALFENAPNVLAQISSALSRPFKMRVEQSLAAESDPVTLYKLSALFNFYFDKISPIIGQEAEFSQTINELNQLALNIFYSVLNNSVQKSLAKMGAPDYDLLPVQAVHQVLLLLRDVLETHDGAMSSRANAKDEFEKIFACVLDPLYRSIQIAATQLHSPIDIAVYTLNCLTAIHSLILLYQFTDKRIEMVKALMEANEDVLVSEEASTILAQTGLINLYQRAAAHESAQGPLSAIATMDSATVIRVLSQFDEFLARPDSCRLDQFSRISSARVRDSVHQRTVDNVVAAYAVIVKKVEDAANKYENVSCKSPEQVKDLLK